MDQYERDVTEEISEPVPCFNIKTVAIPIIKIKQSWHFKEDVIEYSMEFLK